MSSFNQKTDDSLSTAAVADSHREMQDETSLLTTIDSIPDVIYPHIFGYVLGDDLWEHDIIFKREEIECIERVNETFKRNYQTYLKTLIDGEEVDSLLNEDGTVNRRLLWQHVLIMHMVRFGYLLGDEVVDDRLKFNPELYLKLYHDDESLQLVNVLKGCDIIGHVKHLYLCGDRKTPFQRFPIFDFELIKECKTLTHFTFDKIFSSEDFQLEQLENFLSSNKNTLEYLELPDYIDCYPKDYIPKDLSLWPKLKKLKIPRIYSRSKVIIESSTLECLFIDRVFYNDFVNDNMIIKCPNLKVLLVKIIDDCDYDTQPPFSIEWKVRSPCKPYDEDDSLFLYTCHPGELWISGLAVEVSSNCDIGINLLDDYDFDEDSY